MSKKYLIFSISLTLAVASCTCREEVKAYLKDSESGEPVENAEVKTVAALKGNYREGTTKLSDSNGRFVAQYDISNVAKCPVTKLFISKAGYEDKIVISPNTGDTIFLEKTK